MVEKKDYLSWFGNEELIDLINYCIDCENAKADLEVYKRGKIESVVVLQHFVDKNDGSHFLVRAGAREYKIGNYNMSAEGLVSPYSVCSLDRELRSYMKTRFGKDYINDLYEFLMSGVTSEISRLLEEMKKEF